MPFLCMKSLIFTCFCSLLFFSVGLGNSSINVAVEWPACVLAPLVDECIYPERETVAEQAEVLMRKTHSQPCAHSQHLTARRPSFACALSDRNTHLFNFPSRVIPLSDYSSPLSSSTQLKIETYVDVYQ